MEVFANTNWIAVIVGTVACMALGALWYNPKFPTGKIWANGAGVSGEPEGSMVLPMAANTIGLLLAAIFVGAVSMPVAILAILAYGALNTAGGLFAGKALNVGLIHIGYWIVGMILVTIAHSIL